MAASGDHGGAEEEHILALAERSIGRQCLRVLARRRRFAGERGLLRLEVGGLQNARIGRHAVARGDHEDIAGHELIRLDFDRLAAAQDRRLRGRQGTQRLQSAFGPILLEEADEGVQDDDGKNHPAVEAMPGCEGDGGRDQEDVDQRAGKLRQEDARWRHPPARADRIGSVALSAPLRLGLIEALRARLQASECFFRGQRMPGCSVHGLLFAFTANLWEALLPFTRRGPCGNSPPTRSGRAVAPEHWPGPLQEEPGRASNRPRRSGMAPGAGEVARPRGAKRPPAPANTRIRFRWRGFSRAQGQPPRPNSSRFRCPRHRPREREASPAGRAPHASR